MKLTATTYTNPRTGQTFQNPEITTGDLFVSKELVTLNFHLKATGGLDECFKMFWNKQGNDIILVERLDKDSKPFTTVLTKLIDILPSDKVLTYGKMDIIGLANNYEFDGQLPFDFNPTTKIAWLQLFQNVTFFGENLFNQFKTPNL